MNNKKNTNNSEKEFFSISLESSSSRILDAVYRLLDDTSVPNLIKNELQYHLNRANINNKNFGTIIDELFYLMKTYNTVGYSNYLYSNGAHLSYYFSLIDEKYNYCKIVLPYNYDPNKKYDLILIITNCYIINRCSQDDINEFSTIVPVPPNVIIAYVGGRGCSIGAYMWEACLLNEIRHIINEYSIEKDRIFAIADDNMGNSLISFASKYPDLFAGISIKNTPLYSQNIKNLYNVNCLSFSTHEETVNHLFNNYKLKNYLPLLQCINISENKIPVKYQITYLDFVIKNMLVFCRNKYPDTIYYRTENNRNRKAYYIEIISITPGKKFASIQSQIKANEIYIGTKNCSGIKIEIPPRLLNQNFNLIVNGKEFDFEHQSNTYVILKHSQKKGYEICQDLTDQICTYEGYGLLDVYNSPVHVICCDEKDIYIERVCKAFAIPLQNKHSEDLSFEYPIEQADKFVNCGKYSYVIIDKNISLNMHLSKFRDALPIKMDNDGFVYNGKRVLGTYCIMQIVNNPEHSSNSVLYINTNDSTSYLKNKYTNELIIPTAEIGYNPILNGVAIVWLNHRYYHIEEWGADLKEI